MTHLHVDECPSTQDLLLERWPTLKKKGPLLVSTSRQTAGRGRRGHPWVHFDHNIALSFTLKPHVSWTWTSLELAVLVATFLRDRFHVPVLLKWPNDFLNRRGEKIGGLLGQLLDAETVVAGLGLNLFLKAPLNWGDPRPGALLSSSPPSDIQRTLPPQLAHFISSHRLERESIEHEWMKLCAHKGREVALGHPKQKGLFQGLGALGEAVIDCGGKEVHIL